MMKTNGTYVQLAKAIKQKAPELLEHIKSGIVNINDATELSKLPPGKRKVALRQLLNGNTKNHRAAFTNDNRQPYDFYSTPPHATKALLDREAFKGKTWEPAAGSGAIVKVLKQKGHSVVATDIQKGVDFLSTNKKVANIVTNPPYRQALEFVQHAKECATSKVAMLLPLDFLHGQSRYPVFQDDTFPLKSVLVFSQRLQFGDKGSAPMAQGWYAWDKKHQGPPAIEWLPGQQQGENGNGKHETMPRPIQPVARTKSERAARLKATTLIHGDCCKELKKLRTNSVDAIITDPPYPEISKQYGRMSEQDWHKMMREVVVQCRRILKPRGSAVFILQPNHEKVGKMRLWLWRFLLESAEAWNLVQDVFWWSPNSLPTVCANRRYGLLRQSVKMCVWLGEPDCYRKQENILWRQSDSTAALNWEDRCLQSVPSGQTFRPGRIAETVAERGGTTPFNLIPISTAKVENNGKHPASTPSALASWWCQYILPKNGVLLDAFCGSGTMLSCGLDAGGRKVIGIDTSKKYLAFAKKRIGDS